MALLLLAGAWAGAASRSAFDPPGSVARLGDRLERVVPRSLAEHRVPGASVAVVRQGRVAWARGFGVADVRTGARVTPDTRFEVASISKPVAAMAVLRLAESLAVGVDAPIASRLGGWRPRGGDPGGITLGRLLSHTAGLSVPGYLGLAPGSGPPPTTRASLEGRSGDRGPVEIVREAGRGAEYSGGGYTVAQHWAETATGDRFEKIAAEQVLLPVGMNRSSFAQEERPGDAAAHTVAGRPMPSYRYPELAAAGLRATASDLGRFAAVFMPGRDRDPVGSGAVSFGVLDAMTQPAPGTDGAYGLGFHLDSLDDGTRIARHDGSSRGWQGDLVVLPGEGWAIVVLTNADGGGAVAEDVVAELLG